MHAVTASTLWEVEDCGVAVTCAGCLCSNLCSRYGGTAVADRGGVEQPLADQVVEQLLADEVVEQPLADLVVEQPLADLVVEQPLADLVVEQLLADQGGGTALRGPTRGVEQP